MVQFSQKCFKTPTGHNMAYVEWEAEPVLGNEKSDHPKLIICVHGLTRNGRDFDYIARALTVTSEVKEKKCIVACIDILGRGKSDWLNSHESYSYSTYIPLVAAFIEFWTTEKGVHKLDYIGTSMGGIIGMMLFTTAKNTAKRIAKFVINDIGSIVPKEGLLRLGEYVGKSAQFNDMQEAQEYIKRVYSQFGLLTDGQWEHITKYSVNNDKGQLCLHYDPIIGQAFQAALTDDIDLSSFWVAVTCPVLLLHGTNSDLLTNEVIAKMQNSGSSILQVMHFSGCGHAPALMSQDQISCIEDYLLS